MTYLETLAYIFSKLPMFQREGKAAFKKDLTNIIALCEYLGQPQQAFKSIHIAGTNGKGSTAHILSAILQEAGYKVGLYTSPHYKDFRERIKINGQYISEAAVINFVHQLQPFIEAQAPSFFEITVAMAFDYFRQEKVDIAVIETGLGGRLDSTNIIDPELSIITNIGFDHVDMLGDTLPQIAFEKAGIIKKGRPVLIGERQEETSPVFEKKAAQMQAAIFYAEDLIQAKLASSDLSLDHYKLSNNDLGITSIDLDLKGPFQVKNLQSALAGVSILRNLGYTIPEANIISACSKVRVLTQMMGRWEVIQDKNPTIIADSAHNAEGLSYTLEALRQIPHHQLHFIFGMVNDKKPAKLLQLLPKEAAYYFCKADIPRGLDAEQLRELAKFYQLQGLAYPSVAIAFAAALAAAKKDDLVFIGGSIFVVAEIL